MIVNAVARFICLGASINLTIGLLSKLIQCIKFLVIPYPVKLKNALQTMGDDILNINIPAQIDDQIAAQDIPAIFTEYSLEPSFLSNAWGFIVILLSASAVWIVCRGFIWLLQTTKKPRAVQKLRRFNQGVRNFIVVQLYGGIGDILFFSIFEIRSISFGSSWSYVSFIICIIFMLIGSTLICLQCRFLIKYRRIKTRSAIDSPRALKNFTTKNESLRVLYEDFVDTSLTQHGFLLILIMRDVTVSIVIATMVSLPKLQVACLLCCSLLTCIYLMFPNPFRERLEYVSQIIVEICVLTVFTCVLVLATVDLDDYDNNLRERLGSAIVLTNIILNCGGILIMSFKILQDFWEAYKEHAEKKKQRVQLMNDSSILNNHNRSHISIQPRNDRSFLDSSHQQDISHVISTSMSIHREGVERRDHEVPKLQGNSPDSLGHSFNKDRGTRNLLKPKVASMKLQSEQESTVQFEPKKSRLQFAPNSGIADEARITKVKISKIINNKKNLNFHSEADVQPQNDRSFIDSSHQQDISQVISTSMSIHGEKVERRDHEVSNMKLQSEQESTIQFEPKKSRLQFVQDSGIAGETRITRAKIRAMINNKNNMNLHSEGDETRTRKDYVRREKGATYSVPPTRKDNAYRVRTDVKTETAENDFKTLRLTREKHSTIYEAILRERLKDVTGK